MEINTREKSTHSKWFPFHERTYGKKLNKHYFLCSMTFKTVICRSEISPEKVGKKGTHAGQGCKKRKHLTHFHTHFSASNASAVAKFN